MMQPAIDFWSGQAWQQFDRIDKVSDYAFAIHPRPPTSRGGQP